jgi:hypothetical protein
MHADEIVLSRGMRAWIVAIALVVACKGGKDGKGATPGQSTAKGLAGPKVDTPAVLAKDDDKPPFLFLVDDQGEVRLAAAATWADLDANKLKTSKQAAPLDPMDRYVREQVAFGKAPIESIAGWDEYSSSDVALDLESLEERANPAAQDDPPPPEEEDKPDDGEDESGGTGTAMALEEGKMGKQDSDRAEGQYRMQKNQEDPQLARQQAIEQARSAGILGGGGGGSMASGFGFAPPGLNEDGTPARVAHVTGGVAVDGKLERLRAMVLVPPTLKATKLIEIVRDTQAAIAVSHAGKIRPLRIDFGLRDSAQSPDSPFWLEARVSGTGIVVEAVPDKPIEITDIKQLAATLEQARKTRGADSAAPVDVLVEADIDSQRLVDLLVALDSAGVRTIGMGPMPAPEELARRGKRVPTTRIGQPSAQGDLDKALIRRVVKAAVPKAEACYTKALAENSELSGTVQVQFFISPKGKVASASASGVDPALAECVAEVIKKLEFPAPKGGGGVQVNYPFTFRP